MDPEQVGRTEPAAAWPLVALATAVGIAVGALGAAAAAGPPYFDLASLSAWVAVFAVAMLAALLAVPFAANRALARLRPGSAESWEPAMLVWGAVAAIALAGGWALLAAGGFDPGASLTDAAGLVLVVEAGLVLATLLVWLLSV